MEEGATSTDVLAFQEQRHHHETEKRKRDEEIAEKEDSRSDGKEKISKDRGGKEEEKGVITNFISNLVVPRNREAENIEAKDDRMDSDGGGRGDYKLEGDLGGGNGGGTVNKIISNLFQPSEAREREEDKGINKKEEKTSDVKIEEDGGGGGDIIETLVSHLPKALPDYMAPPPEEASILIHSIVHD